MAVCRHFPPACTAAAESGAVDGGLEVGAVHGLRAALPGALTAGPPGAGLLRGSTGIMSGHTLLG